MAGRGMAWSRFYQLLLFRPSSPGWRGHWFLSYVYAAGWVALATLLRQFLARLGVTPPYLTFYPAVALAAWAFGMGPGILATILSILCADYYFTPPIGQFGLLAPGHVVGHFFFVVGGLSVSALAARSRLTEASLRERTRELDDAQLVAGVGSWTWDIASGTVTWSKGLYAIAGFPPDQPAVAYRDNPSLYTPESWQRLQPAVERCLSTGEPYDLELEMIRSDGATRWIVARGEADRGPDGRIVRLRGTVLDITARKGVELELRKEQQFREVLFDSLEEGVITCNAAGILTHYNRASVDIHGLRAEPLSPGQWAEYYGLYFPDTATMLPTESLPLYRALHGEHVKDFEILIKPRHGEARNVLVGGRPLHDAAGNMLGAVIAMRDITEQRRAQRLLQESERQLRAVYERSPVGIALSDARTGRFIKLNPKYCEIVGRTEAELLSLDFQSITHKEDLQRNLIDHRRLVAGEIDSYGLDKRYTRPDGSVAWVSMTAVHLRNGEGSPPVILAMVEDITARRQVEQALRESEERFRLIATHSPDVVYCQDRDLRFTWVHNPVPPHSAADLIGKTDLDFPESATGVTIGITRQVMESGQAWHAEVSVSENGVERWFDKYIQPMLAPDGAICGIVGYARDISARKLVEEQLGHASRYARSLIEASLDPLVTISREGKITDVNAATEQATGVSRAVLIGSDFSDYFTEPEQARRGYRQVFEQGSVRDYPLAIRHPSGRLTHVLYNATLFQNDHGEVEGVFAAARDITQRKALELQLMQAQKMEAVGRLAGGVAHDFNNLLTVVNGYSGLMLMTLPEHDPSRENLIEINRAGERAAALTRQLLAFSRKQLMAPKVLDLNQVVAEVGSMLARLIGENIDLVVDPGPGLARVKADPAQIEQVLMNLAVNARDAMPHGGYLAISTANVRLDGEDLVSHPAMAPGEYVRLSVTDTGAGMDEETRNHAFEPFFTTKATGEGTGLGLSIVYGIVRQSGGDIDVASAPGHGTQFKIYFPRAAEEVERADREAAGLPASAMGTGTILVVEDEGALARFARNVLESAGYTVLVTGQGQEALRIAADYPKPILLLLTDVVLRGSMDGLEVAAQLRKARPETPVMYMTGYSSKLVARGISAKDAVLLAKPFTPAQLLDAVRRAIDKMSPAPVS